MIDWVHKESVTRANVCDTCGHQFSDVCGTCETLDGVPVKYKEKPPLGIKPRYIHDHDRKIEILDGMERYSNAQKPIPVEWILELRALILKY